MISNKRLSAFSLQPSALIRSWLAETEGTADRREGVLLLVATAFVLTNALAYSLVVEGAITWPHLWVPLVWLGVVGVAYLLLSAGRPGHDPFLLPILALLSGWGLILIDRLAVNFLGRQTLWLALSVAIMVVIAIVPRDLQLLQRYRYTWLIGGLLLLGATLIFGVNPSGANAALWLPIPLPLAEPVYFQPSELLKILMVVFLASYFADREAFLNRQTWARQSSSGFTGLLPYLLPLLLMWGFSVVLLVWQRDLGAATLFFMLFITLLYLATGEKLYVLGGLLLLVIAGAFAYFLFSDVVALRIDMWIYPWAEVRDRAYQIVQSLYALSAGGIGGQGVGQGYPDFVPVVHSDFAFAAVAEEWGLVGSLVVVGCFAVLAQRGLRIALLARRPFYTYLAAGITVVFSAQAFLIMGGVTRLLPLTGITLPFVSYGGSSLLVSSVMVGLLLYVSGHVSDAPTRAAAEQERAGMVGRFQWRRLNRLGRVVFLGYTAVALALVYWSVVRSDALLARDDNPRLVIAEQQIQRGRILDRASTALAVTTTSASGAQRQYALTEAAPAVGYYSLRYGTAGVEAGYDAHLRGEQTGFWPTFWRSLLHQPPVGRDIRLTLDSRLQQLAAAEMSGSRGALLLLDVDEQSGTAAIRAMVSTPGFDPNQLDAQFEVLSADTNGPLFNRAAQGRYQPGLMLQPLLVAGALEQGFIQLEETAANANQSIPVNGTTIQCQSDINDETSSLTWLQTLEMACPGPLQALADQWGTTGLVALFETFGLTQSPALPIDTQITPPSSPPTDPLLAAIGQENLTISPLQIALAFGALVNNGRLPTPQLVEAVEVESGEWAMSTSLVESGQVTAESQGEQVIAPDVARQVWQALAGEGTIAEQAVSVLAGPEGTTNSWYVGLTAADSTRYVLLLVLENEPDPAAATQIGQSVLNAALEQQ